MKLIPVIFTAALLGLAEAGFAQGFANFNFESAQIRDLNGSIIAATNAFPGWTVTAPFIDYDDTSLSGGSISIFDSKPPLSLPPVQGTYFAWLIGSGNLGYGAISLGQSGQVPGGTQSISFWGIDAGMQITFAGQPLNFVETGSTANYNIYTADISAYAGQTGQLLFTIPVNNNGDYGFLDNIQFSSIPTPEPSVIALAALGALSLGFFCRRRRYSA
jgi:hypothetical protein